MEYQITLEIDRCTALTFRFFAASWWKIHSQVVEFLSAIFARFRVHLYILRVSSYDGVLSLQGSSWICIYRWNLILFVFESLLHKEETSRNISGKEVDLGRNLFHKQRICHQKSINIQQSFRLGRRATLYRERLIKKEDFKRRYSRDRRRSFSISLVFIRQFWNRVCKRDHVRHKEIIIINRCAEIYSRRNSTGRAIDQPEFRRRWFSQSSYK